MVEDDTLPPERLLQTVSSGHASFSGPAGLSLNLAHAPSIPYTAPVHDVLYK